MFIFLNFTEYTLECMARTNKGGGEWVFVFLNLTEYTRRLYSSLLGPETTLCKTPHFQWIYRKLNQIYEKLRSDQMDPKSALGGPKLISGGTLLEMWSYTSNPCIYFSILLDWRSHLAKTLFILHWNTQKCALFIENYLYFMKYCIRPPYENSNPQIRLYRKLEFWK